MVIKNKILILLFALFFANTAFAQNVNDLFPVDNKNNLTAEIPIMYEILSVDNDNQTGTVGIKKAYNQAEVIIPEEVIYEGITYTVTSIRDNAFDGSSPGCGGTCSKLEKITIPSTVTSIGKGAFRSCDDLKDVVFSDPCNIISLGDSAFRDCTSLQTITIPNSVASIGDGAFHNCSSLTSITLSTSISTIGDSMFLDCSSLTSIVIPEDVTSIGNSAFQNCSNLKTITSLATTAPSLGDYVFGGRSWGDGIANNAILIVPCSSVSSYQQNWNSFNDNSISSNCGYISVTNGDFNAPATWEGVTGEIEYSKSFIIREEHIVTIPSSLTVSSSIVNNGVLRIAYGGQLISENVGGIIEVETPVLSKNAWSFIGAPFTGEGGQYKLETVIPGTNDVSISVFDYYGEGAGAWSADWATIETLVGAGEGFFAWSFANNEEFAFTTYGDGMYSPNANASYASYTYDFTQTPKYQLNNGDVTVTKPLTSNQGNWMALANPYTFKLDVDKFLGEHETTTGPWWNETTTSTIQGDVIYKFNGTSWITNSGDINVTEGFFVNFKNTGDNTATFNKNQRYTGSSKSSAQREFVKLAMVDGEKEVEVLFAHNESAEQEYDIYDANKLFSPIEIAEPYFVTDDIALVKEEVKQLPYYATMNVRSYENKEITFKANNIPSGIIVRIIDGEEIITLSEDATYTTTITAGENADRFKVLFEQARQLADPTAHNITITNHNRTVNISTAEDDLTIKVYNALGQVVLTTKDYNFTLSKVPAGAYMIKAFNKIVSETAKIVVK